MLFGRCPRCRDATELVRADGRYVCEHCARSGPYENVGRPRLPTDGYNCLVFDMDKLLSEL